MNLIILTGRVGKDPEVFTFENGNKKTSFSLAVSEPYKKDGEWKETTEWFNIALFRETKISKGDLVELSGKVKNRSFEKDGATKYFTEIVANSVRLLNRKKEQAAPAQPQKPNEPKGKPQDDDLPF